MLRKLGLLLTLLPLAGVAAEPPALPNLAKGKPYTLFPAPNYALCLDADDKIQLTDGEYSVGYFWTQKPTVGWGSGRPIIITIDLGSDQAIGGLSFSTAAGTAGVGWPQALFVFVSDDSQQWHDVGDLVAASAAREVPPEKGYANHRYWTADWQTHGRFVAIAAAPGTNYFFVDEIEVYAGPPTGLAVSRGVPVPDLRGAFSSKVLTAKARSETLADATRLRQELAAAELAADVGQGIEQQVAAAVAAAQQPLDLPAGKRAVYPYSPAQRRLLAARAAFRRARGAPPVQLWNHNRWAPLSADQAPPAGTAAARVDLEVAGHEQRGAAFCITNNGADDLRIDLRLQATGWPGRPPWLAVQQVEFTGTQAGGPVAAALPAAARTAEGWQIDVPAGLTRQVWLTVDGSPALPPGVVEGRLDLGPAGSVPFTVRRAAVDLPDRPFLSLGGWDYTDAGSYSGVLESNREAVVAFLKQYHVDTPWATGSVMPFGVHDNEGKLTTPPDTSRMDTWLTRWQGARYYAVFNAFSRPLTDSPAARRKVTEWINFWLTHLKKWNVKPEQLQLLLFDEPHEPNGDQVIATYGQVIRAAQPAVQIWTDPTWSDPRQGAAAMYDVNHVLCPNRPMWMGNRPVFEGFYLPRRDAGQKLAFYSCSGPVRSLDPYSYHRLQAWDCFRYGMVAMYYWAFSDNGAGDAWNEFATGGVCYSPQFLSPDGVTTSKHMEGIREGLYDHATLQLLRLRLQQLRQDGRPEDATLKQAAELLRDGPDAVVKAAGNDSIQWTDDKDRDLADRVRLQALRLLEKLR